MKTASAKAKGRRLAKHVCEKLVAFSDGVLQADDCRATSSGTTGEDVQMSPAAREIFPFQIECKNHKAFAIYEHYEQAQSHGEKYIPLLVIKQDNSRPLAVIDLTDFLFLTMKGNKNKSPV